MNDNSRSGRSIGSFAESQQSCRRRRAASNCSTDWMCPYCNCEEFSVDRTVSENNGIYRKRICDDCGSIIETHERIINTQKA